LTIGRFYASIFAMPRIYESKVDPGRALELRSQGVYLSEIAKIYGTTKQNIHKILSNNYPDLDISKFVSYANRPDLFTEVETYKLIAKLDDSTRVKMLERRGVTDIGILIDKTRLLRGQSTSISEQVPTTVINILQARLESVSGNNPTSVPTTKDQVIDIIEDKQ
jgi:hypothetical protein